MGVGREKHVKTKVLTQKDLEEKTQMVIGGMPRYKDETVTQKERDEMLASIGIKDVKTLETIYSTLDDITYEKNFDTALKKIKKAGLPPDFITELNKRNIYIGSKRNRDLRCINYEDAKKLYENKEDLNEIANVLYAKLTIPEYYKLKKLKEYNKNIIEDTAFATIVDAPLGKVTNYEKAVKFLCDAYEIKNDCGFKISANPDYKNLEVSLWDIERLRQLKNMLIPSRYPSEVQRIKKAMQKYGTSLYLLENFESEEYLKQFIECTSDISNSERDALFDKYDATLPSDMTSMVKQKIIVALVKNKIPPSSSKCYGEQIGYIGCKFCEIPRACGEKKHRLVEAFCGNCVSYMHGCSATYENLISGECIFKRAPGPPESSTLRRRF